MTRLSLDTLEPWRGLFEQHEPLASHRIFEINEASDVAAGACQTGDKPVTDRIGHDNKYDWNVCCFALKRSGNWRATGEYDVRLEADQLLLDVLDVGTPPAIVDLKVAADRPS